MIQAFNSVGRRTNDFVRYLVSEPEFRTAPPSLEQLQLKQVAPFLQQCDQCHMGEGYIPTFAEGKIPAKTLAEMRRRINAPDNDKDKMPKNWRQWDEAELNLVKRWLDQGAMGAE